MDYKKIVDGWRRGREAVREMTDTEFEFKFLLEVTNSLTDNRLDEIDKMDPAIALTDPSEFVRECKKIMNDGI